MPSLFTPLTIRGVTFKNRIGMSPMVQYCAVDGLANDWHLVHYGSRAAGGAAVLIVEATAVEARGRITPGDLGLWCDEQVEPLARIARFIEGQGAVPAIQLAHAGRKASHARPWDGEGPLAPGNGGWAVIGPSAIPFDTGDHIPAEMKQQDIDEVLVSYRDAARRALAAGFRVAELHSAHGYLCHQFLSPISNSRTDGYGGEFENRIRFTVEALRAIRSVWPEELPVFVRISCTDWVDGGWTLEDSIALAVVLKGEGADLIDCSSGGMVPSAKIPAGAGYQVPLAEAIKAGAGVPVSAVGFITEPMQADEVVRNNRADLVLLAREELRSPYWPIHAARVLKKTGQMEIPPQYWRAIDGKHNAGR
jgi:2,4-dienoyl-CoA reductase-like NADH-dependent reductase (Old Yellow Enzyme family)